MSLHARLNWIILMKYLISLLLILLTGCNPFLKSKYTIGTRVELTGFYTGCTGTIIGFRDGLCFNGQYTIDNVICSNAKPNLIWVCQGDVK